MARALLFSDRRSRDADTRPTPRPCRRVAGRCCSELLGDDWARPHAAPGVTQQLVIRSLERALAGLYVHRFEGRRRRRRRSSPTPATKAFSEMSSSLSWLKAHGVRTVVDEPGTAAEGLCDRTGDGSRRDPGRAPVVPGADPERASPGDCALQVGRATEARRSCASSRSTARPTTSSIQLPLGIGHSKSRRLHGPALSSGSRQATSTSRMP